MKPAESVKIPLREEFKAHFIIAMPLAAAYLAEIGMVLTDNAIVGRLGALELAAGLVVTGVLLAARFVILSRVR